MTEEEKRHIRILLVEDNQEFANLVELFLRKQKDMGSGFFQGSLPGWVSPLGCEYPG